MKAIQQWRVFPAARNFIAGAGGQDLIEYTLVLAFVALASVALFTGLGGSIRGVWGASNTQLTAANTSVS